MIRIMVLALVLLAPVGLPAAAQSASERQSLVSAIAAAGCRVNAGNSASVLSAAGLSEEAAGRVVDQLVNRGDAERVGGELVLKTGGC